MFAKKRITISKKIKIEQHPFIKVCLNISTFVKFPTFATLVYILFMPCVIHGQNRHEQYYIGLIRDKQRLISQK